MSESIIKIGEQEVKLDSDKFEFNEATINEYLTKEAGWYDYFGQKLADAELILQVCEMEYDSKYSEKFRFYKEDGCSDKLAEAKSKSDVEVEVLKKKVVLAKSNVKKLQQHLRAWDRNHDNAQSFGYNMRKSMDKLNTDIKLEQTIKGFD